MKHLFQSFISDGVSGWLEIRIGLLYPDNLSDSINAIRYYMEFTERFAHFCSALNSDALIFSQTALMSAKKQNICG